MEGRPTRSVMPRSVARIRALLPVPVLLVCWQFSAMAQTSMVLPTLSDGRAIPGHQDMPPRNPARQAPGHRNLSLRAAMSRLQEAWARRDAISSAPPNEGPQTDYWLLNNPADLMALPPAIIWIRPMAFPAFYCFSTHVQARAPPVPG